MKLYNAIKNYIPFNEQEAEDKVRILKFIDENPDFLYRENLEGHMTTSIWTVNKERTKTLMVYHNIYDSWSWVGGHADGEDDLRLVALRELQEETGIGNASFINDDIFSIEILDVAEHMKKGKKVPAHLHFNVTYIAEADEECLLHINEEENKAVRWFTFEDALKASSEPWMVENVYEKLIAKTRTKLRV
ncbi:MAG: NUDIX hydrolase [Firmicutes bacterium]|nr:NUDIX hydrolase [Bacillota bacterium]